MRDDGRVPTPAPINNTYSLLGEINAKIPIVEEDYYLKAVLEVIDTESIEPIIELVQSNCESQNSMGGTGIEVDIL